MGGNVQVYNMHTYVVYSVQHVCVHMYTRDVQKLMYKNMYCTVILFYYIHVCGHIHVCNRV